MIGGDRWAENPAIVLPRWAFSVVDLWLRIRRHAQGSAIAIPGPSGPIIVPTGGSRALPGPGGFGDQPAALIDAFDVLDEAVNECGEGG